MNLGPQNLDMDPQKTWILTDPDYRIQCIFHWTSVSDPDPGSHKCLYGTRSGNRTLTFKLDPDPKGEKIKLIPTTFQQNV